MPLTHSGINVTPYVGVPTLLDIGLGLSRVPRFGGQTTHWWTVLDHAFFTAELARKTQSSSELVLAMLLHDAHEALTGDIPTDMKTPSMRILQRRLDRGIMAAYYPRGFAMYDTIAARVKKIDRRALLAEARVIGPPAYVEGHTKYRGAEYFEYMFGDQPSEADVALLRDMRSNSAYYGNPRSVTDGAKALNVGLYVDQINTLRPLVEQEIQGSYE